MRRSAFSGRFQGAWKLDTVWPARNYFPISRTKNVFPAKLDRQIFELSIHFFCFLEMLSIIGRYGLNSIALGLEPSGRLAWRAFRYPGRKRPVERALPQLPRLVLSGVEQRAAGLFAERSTEPDDDSGIIFFINHVRAC
jgi:hypothetical protein